jgi:predicted dehydrogenase
VTVRIGIVGSGFARRVQLPGLSLVPGAQVTAIASGHRVNAEAVAAEFGIPHVFDDGVALARSDAADLVIVASTPPSHAAVAIAALRAGKHVLCEKPMALNAAEAAEMVAAAEQAKDRVAWIDHELRYEPNRLKVRDLVRRGDIGELRHLELLLRPYRRGDGRPQTGGAPWSWWYDVAQGGGILGAVGSHLIDLCRFWTGSEVVQVGGCVATFDRERPDAAGVSHPVTADEFTSCVLTMASGAVATLTLSTVAHHGPGHLAHLTGREGSLVLTGESRLEIGRPGAALEDISVPDDLAGRTGINNMWARSFVRLARDLVRTAGGAAPSGDPAGFEDGWRAQRVLDAVRAGSGTPLD